MLTVNSEWLCAVILVFNLVGVIPAQQQPAVPQVAQNSAADETALQRLAERLVAAKTEEERKALLASEKGLVASGLLRALISQGDRLRGQRNYPQAHDSYQLARTIAEEIVDRASEATAINGIGDAQRALGNATVALEHYRQSLAIRQALGDKAGQAQTLQTIAFAYSVQGNSNEALEYHRLSLALWEALGNRQAVAARLLSIGEVYRRLPPINQDLALEAFRKCLAIREELGDQAGAAEVLVNIGFAYSLQNNLQAALEAYQKGSTLYKTLGNERNLARIMVSLSIVQELLGQTESSAETFRQGLALLKTKEDKTRLAQTLQETGQGHQLRGEINLASKFYERSHVLFEALGDKRLLALLLRQMGHNYLNLSYPLALDYYRKSLALAETLQDKTLTAGLLQNIGGTHISQGSYQTALEYFRRSLALWEELGNRAAIAEAINNHGNLFNMQGNYALALQYYQTALARLEAPGNRSIDDNHWTSIVLRNIGEVYANLGNDSLALEYLQRSLKLREAIGGNQAIKVHVLLSIGDVYQRRGKYEEALECYGKGVTVAEALGSLHHLPYALLSVGKLHLSRGDYDLALESLQRGLRLYEEAGLQLETVNALNLLAKVHYAKNDYAQAAHTAEQAANRARQAGRSKLLWQALATAGQARRALGQLRQARTDFDEAIATVEAMRGQVVGGEAERQQFFENKLTPYHAQIELLVADSHIDEALFYAERAKARTLLDVLHGGRANITKAMTAQEQQQEQSFSNELISLNAQVNAERQQPKSNQAHLTELSDRLQKVRQGYEAFQASLYLAHPELRAKRGEAPPFKLEEAASLLPDTTSALLEYVVTDEQIFLFALTKNGPGNQATVEAKVYSLAIDSAGLTKLTTQYRQQLARRSPDFASSARALYDLLLKPSATQLRGKTALVIVPDGPLWELPFQTLQRAPNRYLIEDHTISFAPSLTVLREMAKTRRKPADSQPTLLAFGNPALGQATVTRAKTVLMDEKFEPLPEAEAQVKTLGRLYGAQRTKIYVGAEAREERAKAEAADHRILHLATHGVLNNASPLYSHLLLAQTEGGVETKEDGLLEAWELMKLDLNADLVVLSACETARGRVGAGEGVIGLTWALFVAGCPRTVVSQWKVESASTTELMVGFHRQLKARMQNPKSSLGAAQALRAAALKMLRGGQYRHPFWWAGFVVVGDGF
ncbi:MAG: CHAT domain-containing protein [Blastocatellales bacterium]